MLNCLCCDDQLQATESVLEKLQLLIYKIKIKNKKIKKTNKQKQKQKKSIYIPITYETRMFITSLPCLQKLATDPYS